MAVNRIAGMMARPQDPAAEREERLPARHEGGAWPGGLGWPIIGLGVAALVVLGSIYVLPDVMRYMKMRSM